MLGISPSSTPEHRYLTLCLRPDPILLHASRHLYLWWKERDQFSLQLARMLDVNLRNFRRYHDCQRQTRPVPRHKDGHILSYTLASRAAYAENSVVVRLVMIAHRWNNVSHTVLVIDSCRAFCAHCGVDIVADGAIEVDSL
jgi:hypothetical protein